jgi:hypothetical protein
MPTLKTDGQNCCALLLGLRNDYQFLSIKCMSINDLR